MGPAFVLIFWAVIGGAFALIAGSICALIAALLTRGARRGRIRAILGAAIFPLLCVMWAGGVLVVVAVIDTTFFQRDMGFGDAWFVPLPNGYTLLMIDTFDDASICPTEDWQSTGCADDLSAIKTLQVAGPYLLGQVVNGYFLFDTRTRVQRDFPRYEGLTAAAHKLGIQPALRPVAEVYNDYRFVWPDGVGLAAILGVPLLGAAFGLWWIIRLRRDSSGWNPPLRQPASRV